MVARVARLTFAALLATALLCCLWALAVLVQVRGDLVSARAALQSIRDDGDADRRVAQLSRAESDLDRAVDRLSRPGPAAVAAVPLLGRPVDAVTRTAVAGLAVVQASSDVLSAADSDRPVVTAGGLDLALLRDIGRALDRAAERSQEPVEELAQQPTGLLPAFLAGPVRDAQDELTAMPETFARAAAAVRGLTGVFGDTRPRRLVLALQNNAELRGTGGVVTVFAEATAVDGRLEIGPFRDVEDVADDPADVVTVEAPEDYVRLWGPFLANTTLWVNANMTPDVPTASAVLAEVATVSLPQPPDAVLWFDVPAIAAVLDATGPVQLPDGSRLTADNAVQTLLSDTYKDVPDTREGQAERRAVLRRVADAVLGGLLRDDRKGAPLTVLGRALAESAAGRHVVVWSSQDDEQADLVAAGLAGQVAAGGGDLVNVTVQNLGGGDGEGNKLDYYARRDIDVRAVVGPDEAVVGQEITLRNTAPAAGLPRYVAGGTAGTTNNLVTLALPARAELLEFRRGEAALAAEVQPAGDHAVVTDVVSLSAGTSVTWTLRYRTPVADGRYHLTVVPQPQAFDGELRIELTPGDAVALEAPVGSTLSDDGDGRLVLEQPFNATVDLDVWVEPSSWSERAYDAVRRFWNEPVRLP